MTTRTLAEWLAYIERQHPRQVALGLERVREVAQRMGLKRPARKVITIAGTNGKGSTVAFIEAIARAAGWKVGAYTSPHLLRLQRTRAHRWPRRRRCRPRRRLRGGGSRARRSGADLFRVRHVVRAVAVRAQPARPGGARGRPRWPPRRGQHGRRGRRRDHHRRSRPPGLARQRARGDRFRESRHRPGVEAAGAGRGRSALERAGHAYAIGAAAMRANCDFLFERVDAGTGAGARWGMRSSCRRRPWRRPRRCAMPRPRSRLCGRCASRWRRRRSCRGSPMRAFPGACSNSSATASTCWSTSATTRRPPANWPAGCSETPTRDAPCGVRRTGRQGHRGRRRRAGRVGRWLVPGGAGGAGPRGEDVAEFAKRLEHTAAASGFQHADVPAALAAARRLRRQATASSCSVLSIPWRRPCSRCRPLASARIHANAWRIPTGCGTSRLRNERSGQVGRMVRRV